jgi:hypothetical protein
MWKLSSVGVEGLISRRVAFHNPNEIRSFLVFICKARTNLNIKRHFLVVNEKNGICENI